MSRVGRAPVTIPGGVSVSIAGRTVSAKGKLGQSSATLMDEVEISQDGSTLIVRPRADTKRHRTMWGTARMMVHNLVQGVDTGFVRRLEIQGVGYRAQTQGRDLVLQLGYSHEVRYPVPDGIKIECPDQTHIVVSGSDKQRVGQVAAELRTFRPAEPYKGKGLRYQGEVVLRKQGKKK
jgi:large subunit ribosomal protein L6